MSDDRPSSGPSKKSWLEKVADVFAGEPKDRQDLKEILYEAQDKDILDKEVFRIIDGALNVSELHVRDIMIPRSQMVSIDSDQTFDDMLPSIIESGHSRFPVIGENHDEVTGVLLAKDLLLLGSRTGFNTTEMSRRLKEIIRPATFVPESKRLNILLNDFRINRNHMAIVVDEYGGIAGLVTIEDVLEEIVGKIDDEHDSEEQPNIRMLNPDVYIWVESVGTSSFVLNYEISSKGVLHARIKTVQVAISLATKKSRPLSDTEREFLKEYMA